MVRLGLTGSIATGKSTTAAMFADEGIPVHDADAAVHAIYEGEGVEPVGGLIPQATKQGFVDRAVLRAALADQPDLLPKLEAIVHPLVRARTETAIADAAAAGHWLIVLDIPLLFETGAQDRLDQTVVTVCDPAIQKERLMARPGMTEETATFLMGRQMPQDEKRARADHVIDTGHGLEAALQRVRAILAALKAEYRG
ncbi:MAG: dephospho-CoA kinase [Devosiaceae bacterium]|nr:dephospho-CoA kinase [Devosiaceae bacterium MH13]